MGLWVLYPQRFVIAYHSQSKQATSQQQISYSTQNSFNIPSHVLSCKRSISKECMCITACHSNKSVIGCLVGYPKVFLVNSNMHLSLLLFPITDFNGLKHCLAQCWLITEMSNKSLISNWSSFSDFRPLLHGIFVLCMLLEKNHQKHMLRTCACIIYTPKMQTGMLVHMAKVVWTKQQIWLALTPADMISSVQC